MTRSSRNGGPGTRGTRLLLSFLLAGLFALPSSGEELSYYLPSQSTYDSNIPTPKSVIGFDPGEWHVRHDLLVQYMYAVAEASDRVTIEVQGYTHERRPQVLLVVTSPENHSRLEDIRSAHLALSDGQTTPTADQPVVIYLGYSIHGNEASGSNASMITAYHFAAAQDEATKNQLDNMVLLIDPSLNPDGLGRFAQWANMHRATGPLVGDPQSREHNEVWPGGRTNHYWFDLNRDWLLLSHPESRNRVATLRKWRPNLVGDYHEMGTNSTYFFQPGVEVRKNPLIPARNVEITKKLARFHADRLEQDVARRLFYTQEGFDDFYPGKGSTYPDLQGAVGVLFEQASSRGHLQESRNGPLSFSFGIKNHFLASLSMVEGAVALKSDFLDHQAQFFADAAQTAAADPRQAIVFQTANDTHRQHLMEQLLLRHGVELYRLGEDQTLDGRLYAAGKAAVVPLRQTQYVLIRSLFERQTEFADSVFYDVSSWTLPLAFDAHDAGLNRLGNSVLGDAIARTDEWPSGAVTSGSQQETYAYLFEWHGYHAPRALHHLLDQGVKARLATDTFRVETTRGPRRFELGTVVIPTGLSGNQDLDLEALLTEVSERDGVDVFRATTGLSSSGIDLGSPSLIAAEKPKPAILGGRGASGYEVGEAWHLLDHKFGIETTILETRMLGFADLDRYTHLILTNGSWGSLSESETNRIRDFVRSGGAVVAIKAGATWAQQALLGIEDSDAASAGEYRPEPEARDEEDAAAPKEDQTARRAYADFSNERAEALISGTIVGTELDLTHPLAYGYDDEELALFRTFASVLPPSDNPYENVAVYTNPPRISGYISDQNQERLAGSAAVMARRLGGGVVVQLMDNPNFRAYWNGATKLFLNGLFLSPAISHTQAPEDWLP